MWNDIKKNIIKITQNLEIPLENLPDILYDNIYEQTYKYLISIFNTIKTQKKLEDKIEIEKQIKFFTEKRCEHYTSNQKVMINSILEREQQSIRINRCVINKDGEDEILLSPDDVKEAAKNHFSNISNNNHTIPNALPSPWLNQYKPIKQIDPTWYSNLMSPITLVEWYSIINTLPNGKASGPSGITNEMLKHIGKITQQFLLKIINQCITTNDIPDAWREATVYLIPKPQDWELQLNNTRPITLLETPRKALVKIINNRISEIIMNHNILKGYNFAGLPGKSTHEPIHILNMLMEDARENNKEMWVLFQDMSKAYDLVNRDMLQLALKRIALPNSFCKFIHNIFNKRVNRIVTEFGLTNQYTINNGIDQGEVISPLMWCIYYDPLLCEIQYHKSLGYQIEVEWKQDLRYNKTTKLSEMISGIAYMDDTTWIAPSKDNMELILKIADSFYDLNGIKVNKKKSELLVINSPTPIPSTSIRFGKDGTEVHAKPINTSIRFLGVWINAKGSTRHVKNSVRDEIINMESIMKHKHLTDKQILYIFNHVMIPRLEYCLQHTLLSENECKILGAKCRKLFKQKVGLASTAPNAATFTHTIYNLCELWDRQVQHHITNLVVRLNDNGILGKISKIKLHQLQLNLWLSKSPLESWNYSVSHLRLFKNNLMAGILCIAKFFKFSFRTTYDSESFIIKGGQILLQDIFAEKYTSFVNALAKKQVLYLDQILCCEGTHLLSWKQVVLHLKINICGRKPKWFSSLEESILHNSSCEVLNQWKLPRCNSFTIQYSLNFPKDSRIRPFIATYQFGEIIFGKTYELASPKNNNQLIITHWKSNINMIENNHDSIQLSQCKGCELNNITNNSNRICLYNKPQKECIVIPAKKYNSSGSNIITITFPRCEIIKALEYNIDRFNNNNDIIIPINPTIYIEDNRLTWIKNIINEPISLQLYNIHMSNNYINQLEFWTDGSLKNPSSPNIKLGNGWIQVDKDKKIINSFSGALSQWPSSTRAEIFL
jgi:hypothetical protein